jgi:hypothetical protein
MSLEAMAWARPLVLPTTQKVVLFLLADMADSRGEARPSQALIGRWTGLSERAVRMSLGALRDHGLLEFEASHGRCLVTRYRLCVGAAQPVVALPKRQGEKRHTVPGLAASGSADFATLPGDNRQVVPVLVAENRQVVPGLQAENRQVVPGLAPRQPALLLPLAKNKRQEVPVIEPENRQEVPVLAAGAGAENRHDVPPEASPSLSSEGSSGEGRVSRRAARVARGTRLPEGWMPDAAGIEFARSVNVPLQRTLEDFRDYWLAAPGADGLKADWPATWRRWCRTEQQKLARGAARGARALTPAQKQAESMERWFRRDADRGGDGASDLPDHPGPVIDMAANGDWR